LVALILPIKLGIRPLGAILHENATQQGPG
jgi:hypothetical protein